MRSAGAFGRRGPGRGAPPGSQRRRVSVILCFSIRIRLLLRTTG